MKQTILKAFVFWIVTSFTILLIWYAYAAVSTATTWWTLTATMWNDMKAVVDSNETKLNTGPILWHWRQATQRSWVGKFIWDSQLANTDSNHYGWTAAQDHIVIKEAGYYEIDSDVLVYWLSDNQRSDVYIYRNTWVISMSLWIGWNAQQYYKHHNHFLWYFNANDQVSVELSSAWSRYNSTRSNIFIKKISY